MKTLVARIVSWSFRVFRIVQGGSRAVFEGFWLGILPESVADITTVASYGEGEQYTSDAWVDSGFQFWEDLAISRYFPAEGKVLVAAAGGGREMIALARAGYRVDGFECSLPMVEAGRKALRERGIDALLEWAPPSAVPQLSEHYDAAIIGWNAWSYIVPAARRQAFLRSIQAYLIEGAPVLISFGMIGSRGGIAEWTPRIANFVLFITFRRGRFDTGVSFPTRPRQDFTEKRVRGELLEAGFAAEAWLRWGPFGATVGRKAGKTGG
jgi:hypothetical protein